MAGTTGKADSLPDGRMPTEALGGTAAQEASGQRRRRDGDTEISLGSQAGPLVLRECGRSPSLGEAQRERPGPAAAYPRGRRPESHDLPRPCLAGGREKTRKLVVPRKLWLVLAPAMSQTSGPGHSLFRGGTGKLLDARATDSRRTCDGSKTNSFDPRIFDLASCSNRRNTTRGLP